jgi:hypothetical protein
VADSGSAHPNLDPERVAEARLRAKGKLKAAEDLRAEANRKESEAWRIQRTWGISDEKEV